MKPWPYLARRRSLGNQNRFPFDTLAPVRAIGVSNLQGITAPATGQVQQSASEWQFGLSEDPDDDGNSRFVVPYKYLRRECCISSIGDAELASVAVDTVSKVTVTVYHRKDEENAAPPPNLGLQRESSRGDEKAIS